MLELLKRNPLAAASSLFIHLLIVAFMVIGVDWREPPRSPVLNVEMIEARTVDLSAIQQVQTQQRHAEIQRIQEEKRKVEEEQRRLEQERKAEEAERQAEEVARLEEQVRKQEVERQKVAEEKRKLEEKQKEEQKQEAEKKKKEEEAKKAAEEKKKAEEKAKAEAEKKKKEEEAKKAAEEKKKAEEKAKAEAEKKKKEEEAKRAAEEARKAQEAAQASRANAGELERYMAMIDQKVGRNFAYAGATQGLKCVLLVRLAAGGYVLDVQITQSSGNPSFDRAARAAVLKAGDLPVPPDPRLFEQFRELKLVFDPARFN